MQMDFFYRKRKWYAGQFVRKITPKIQINEMAVPFFSAILNKQKTILLSVLVRNVDDVFRKLKVYLPVKGEEIDFDFIESFIATLELLRMEKLATYMQASGLADRDLLDDECKALQELEHLQWHEFKMGDLFDKVQTRKLPYKAKELPTKATGDYVLPCLTSSFKNQGLNYYAPKTNATILKHVITIPQNSDVYRAYYQSSEFTVLSDAYAIEWKYDDRIPSRNQYLFMLMCINKVTDLPLYSFKIKLGGWKVVRNKYIMLPIRAGEIDFGFMEEFISAIRKLSVKEAVKHIDRRLTAAKQVVQRSRETM